mmetsp:Transcript_192/g.573  ORF Transcript_192/g.573 Transcript_192/m.573 type:complete len:217 (-) Transcript_192:3-653(-)
MSSSCEALLEALGDRQQVGIEPRTTACHITKVDVSEELAIGSAQQHIVLVAICQTHHKAGSEGPDSRVVQLARVREALHVAHGNGIVERLDKASARASGKDVVRAREAARARLRPDRVHLAQEQHRRLVGSKVVAHFVKVLLREAAADGRESHLRKAATGGAGARSSFASWRRWRGRRPQRLHSGRHRRRGGGPRTDEALAPGGLRRDSGRWLTQL